MLIFSRELAQVGSRCCPRELLNFCLPRASRGHCSACTTWQIGGAIYLSSAIGGGVSLGAHSEDKDVRPGTVSCSWVPTRVAGFTDLHAIAFPSLACALLPWTSRPIFASLCPGDVQVGSLIGFWILGEICHAFLFPPAAVPFPLQTRRVRRALR